MKAKERSKDFQDPCEESFLVLFVSFKDVCHELKLWCFLQDVL